MDRFEVLIVGAGFAGVYQLHKMRQLGFKVRLFEAGERLGGIWHWNCYPGARVDSSCSIYQYSAPELSKHWEWSEKYPGWEELRRYFNHVDKKWNISRDVDFNTRVTRADFDEATREWVVQTNNGKEARAQYLIFCLGFASKPHIPKISGLGDFRGECHHTGLWPQDGLDMTNKRVGIIGTGASGIQVAQEAAKVASHLIVFQRTPNLFLPMRQEKFTAKDNETLRHGMATLMEGRKHTFAGFDYDFMPKKTFAVTDSERNVEYERLWAMGGFAFWLATFEDLLFDEAANRVAYDFWRDKTRESIKNPDLWEKLAPTDPPHPFGVKRPGLSQNYAEIFAQDNVELVDIRETPITGVTGDGLVTTENSYPLELLVLATGFDAVTGGLTNVDIRATDGESLAQKWTGGVRTHLGVATAGFPNMFFSYGPQAPTGFLNGPTSAELQGECLGDCIQYMRSQGKSRIEATKEAENVWHELNNKLVEETLFPLAESWYMGANIPGKKRETLNYPGGCPDYFKRFSDCAAAGYEGFAID